MRPDLHPESNVYVTYRIRKGDMAEGWEQAEVVVEGSYEVPYQEHAYLQPEAAVSYIDEEGRITVDIAGQWTHEDQEQIAHALDLPPEQVRVIYPAIGGAFGGREDMSLQIVMALAAWRLAERGEHRPIRCQWSREESIVGHHKRHRGRVHARWGATADGRRSWWSRPPATSTPGAYNYTTNKVLGNLHLCVAGPYEIPNAGRRQPRRADQCRARRRLPRLRRPAGRLRGRDPDEQAGRTARDRPRRAPAAQRPPGRLDRADRHGDAARA